jgi:hypothetical protein
MAVLVEAQSSGNFSDGITVRTVVYVHVARPNFLKFRQYSYCCQLSHGAAATIAGAVSRHLPTDHCLQTNGNAAI